MSKKEPHTHIESEDFLLFNDLYNKNYSGFLRFANSYLNDMAAAEDFVADSFMAYWNNRVNVRPNSNAKVYILVILKNKCLNYLRHQKSQKNYADKVSLVSKWDLEKKISTLEACDPTEIFSNEIRDIVDKALMSMPEKTLMIFKMSRYENKSTQQIAELMGLSNKGVEFHIRKALNILRLELKDYLPALMLLFFLDQSF